MATVLGLSTITAQTKAEVNKEFYKPGKRIGISVGFGIMDGIDIEASTSLTKWCSAHVGVSIMPDINYKFSQTESINVSPEAAAYLAIARPDLNVSTTDVNFKASMSRTQVHVLFDAYPFPDKSNFFVSAGFYFLGDKVLNINGEVGKNLIEARDALKDSQIPGFEEDINVDFEDYGLPVDNNGNINAALQVSGFRPYVGVGFGRAIPKKRVSCRFDLGVQFQGAPKLVDKDGKDFRQSSFYEGLSGSEKKKADNIVNVIEKFSVMPCLKFSIRGRIL